MTPSTKMNGLAMAAAAAALFLSAPLTFADDMPAATSVGHCMGVNSCKGQGACKSKANSCKGQNACKGQGFMEMTQPDCTKAGGKFEAAPKK
jgi:hypothetical protein